MILVREAVADIEALKAGQKAVVIDGLDIIGFNVERIPAFVAGFKREFVPASVTIKVKA